MTTSNPHPRSTTGTVPPPSAGSGHAPGTATAAARPDGLDASAPPFTRLVRIELRKATDTLTGRWLMIVTGVLVVGALVLGAYFPPGGGDADLTFLLANALLPVSLLLPVLGVLLLSGEFSTRSVLTTFALVPSRGRVVAAKAVGAVLLAVAGTALTGLLTLVAAGVLDLAAGFGSWSVEPVVLLQMLVAQVVYVLVGVGFGLLCQNTPLAVVTYLLVPSILAPVVMLVPALSEVGPWIDLTTGTAPLLMAEAAEARQWAHTATVTAIWAGVPAALGWLRLQRREIA